MYTHRFTSSHHIVLLVALLWGAHASLASAQEQPTPPEPGDEVPTFEYALLGEDRTVSDESLRGGYTMIYMWSTRCGVCRQEMSVLHDVYEALRGENFEIVSLSLDEDVEDVHAYREQEHPMPWKHVFVGGGRDALMDVQSTFGAVGVPLKLLVSPDGTVLEVIKGGSGDELLDTIAAHLD